MVTMWLAACGGGRTLPSSAAPPRATVPPVPTTTFSPITTTTAEPGHWPRRTITGTGTVQDIAPTSQALYWLVVTTPASAAFMTVTPVRDDLGSLQMTGGSPLTGVVGSPALTVTGGWVWVVIGQGPEALLEQLDPGTLAIHAERRLPVDDTLHAAPPAPVLTATVGGPLWVAAGAEVWALNPATGDIETEFMAGDLISSLSTDPAGQLLYTGGVSPGRYGMTVTQYDARSGRELDHSDQQFAVGDGTVAATNGGVWVSYRSGMAGSAQELSSSDLHKIAPPTDPTGPFDTFDQIMGVGSGVSEGVLWLTSTNSLTCADPRTGRVRADESANVSLPVAAGHQLYAVPAPSGGITAITPPTACFAARDA